MEYQTLYRRWRPRNFADFVGQNHVVITLSNAIESNRIAHAYLFTGPRGTGKTSTAKIFAKALNCTDPQRSEPCDRCSNCTRINDGIYLDVMEIDGASNRGIDEIRELREKVKFAPIEGKYKIYIIDEVHMLTAEAFNALLKTLEEPPKFVIFILATTEAHKIPATILSRCQRFDFKRFTVEEITGRLIEILAAEKVKANPRALDLIAKHSEGGMRDALALLEQALAHCQTELQESDVRAILGLIDQEVIDRITTAIKNRDIKEALTILNEICLDGKDFFQFGRSLITHFRELLLASFTEKNQSPELSSNELVRILEIMADATNEVKKSYQSSLPLELALIKITTQPSTVSGDWEKRLTRLESLFKEHLQQNTTGKPVATTGMQAKIPEVSTPTAAEKLDLPIQIKKIPSENPAAFTQWSDFLEAVKKKKRTLAALIQEGNPVRFEAGELVVGFPSNLKFHMENIELPQNITVLENILQEVTGGKLKLTCIPITNSPPAPAELKLNNEPEALTKAVNLFGGAVEPVSKEEPK